MADPERGLGAAGVSFTDEQLMNAGAIVDVGMQMGLDDQTIAAALATALMESNLRNLPGGDRDSVGLFQQRPSQGWGTVAQINDQRYAARKFFEAYLRSKGTTVLEKIANTQRPAAQYRDRYANFFDLATSALHIVTQQRVAKPDMGAAATKQGQPRSLAQVTGAAPAASSGPSSTSGTITTAAASTTAPDDKLPPNATEPQITAWIKKHYPDAAMLLGNKEIHDILFWSAAEDASPDVVAGYVRQSEYWKSHGPASRAFDIKLAEDPTGAHQDINRVRIVVDQAYKRQGVTKTHDELDKITLAYIRGGWTDQDLQRYVANELQKNPEEIGPGQSAATANDIIAMARAQGLPLDLPTAQKWALDIAAGRETPDGVKAKIQAYAMSRWQNDPDVLRTIQNGGTAADYFAPYRSVIAQTLELAPDAVDIFNDPRFAQVTQIADPKTGQKRSMTLGETITWARNRPEFRNTRQFQETQSEKGMRVLSFLGQVPQ